MDTLCYPTRGFVILPQSGGGSIRLAVAPWCNFVCPVAKGPSASSTENSHRIFPRKKDLRGFPLCPEVIPGMREE